MWCAERQLWRGRDPLTVCALQRCRNRCAWILQGLRCTIVLRRCKLVDRKGCRMHITKDEIPVKIDVPGAIARQAVGFGDPSGFGELGGEYFSLGAGTDIAPLLKGLEGDACQAPHWGYMLSGEVVVTYTDGTAETCAADDLFYWPPGHSVRVSGRRGGDPLQPTGRAHERDGPHAHADGRKRLTAHA